MRTGIGHRQLELLVVLDLKVLVLELFAVDALAAGAVAAREVAYEEARLDISPSQLPRVAKANLPPWSMKPLIQRWKSEP